MSDRCEVERGHSPLIVSLPHTGTDIPVEIAERLVSPWLARKDTDWWVHLLYHGTSNVGTTTIRTRVSRTVIDVNRNPSGAALYPGTATTDLCPITTFDGEPLYQPNCEPTEPEIKKRLELFFEPYHAALFGEITRLRRRHRHVVLYDAHSIRSQVPRLFDGMLPHINLGTNDGRACATKLTQLIEQACQSDRFCQVTNGRFKGGWTTRRYGDPEHGVHAVQMELACRGYVIEPAGALTPENWPPHFDAVTAAPMRTLLGKVLEACVEFAESLSGASS